MGNTGVLPKKEQRRGGVMYKKTYLSEIVGYVFV